MKIIQSRFVLKNNLYLHIANAYKFILHAFTITILLSFPVQSRAQDQAEIKIGEGLPYFSLSNVEYFSKKEIALNDFKGKWLIIEFWSQFCSGCLAGFPRIDSLQKKYDDKIKFLLIGRTSTHILGYDPVKETKDIKSLYEKMRKKYKLNLSIAYDSVLSKRYNIQGSPTYVIVDTNGIVKGKTNSLTEKAIISLLKGETPLLSKTIEDLEYKRYHSYNRNLPLLTTGNLANGGIDTGYLYRSVLTEWDTSLITFYPPTISPFNIRRSFEAIGVNIRDLYMYAYIGHQFWGLQSDSLYGKFWREPICEIENPSLLYGDEETGRNMYSYSLTVPLKLANKNTFMKFMQRDLYNYFGYEVSIEEREMPYWSLRLVSPAFEKKLKTKSDTSYIRIPSLYQGIIVKNKPLKAILDLLHSYNDLMPLIDDTGISFNVDLALDVLMIDLGPDSELSEKLRKQGLIIVKSTKPMKVLIIRDEKYIAFKHKEDSGTIK